MIKIWIYPRKKKGNDRTLISLEKQLDILSSEPTHELPKLGINHYAVSTSDLEKVKMKVQKNLENGESLIANELKKPKGKKRKQKNNRFY